MKPLIDGDIFLYEVGWGAETGWKAVKGWVKGDEPLDPPPFDYVAELLDNKIADICGKVFASSPPTIFISGKDNFREQIAKKKGYKENRADVVKPFHYANIKAYLQTRYECIVVDGMEADDAMCIEQMKGFMPFPHHNHTIICSRDKDLKQCPGWQYSWELNKQPEWGPFFVSGFGEIELAKDRKKIVGHGEKFFYSQMLTGDVVDNVPGVPGMGAVGAYELLVDTQTSLEAEEAVAEAYRGFYGDSWREEMLEQGQLLYMVRELDEEGKPIMWKMKNEDDNSRKPID